VKGNKGGGNVFRTFVLMGTWVLSECILLVSMVACVLIDEMEFFIFLALLWRY
jgi:hypothetical protein